MMELNLMDYLTWSAGIFFLMQFINVVLSTLKTVLTVKANKHVAMLINTVTYTFYSGVVKLLTEQNMVVVLAVTFLTNVIGVYIAMFILERAKKDVLWKIEVTVPKEEMEDVMLDAKALEAYGVASEDITEAKNTKALWTNLEGL